MGRVTQRLLGSRLLRRPERFHCARWNASIALAAVVVAVKTLAVYVSIDYESAAAGQVLTSAFVSPCRDQRHTRQLEQFLLPTRASRRLRHGCSLVQRSARGGGVGSVTDPWKELGVEPGAKLSDIKRAYRRRALKEHPDVNKAPDAKERWQKLSEAYDILSDPAKQKAWEAAKRQGFGTGAGGGPRRRSWSSTGGQKGPGQTAMDEEYDTGGDSFGAIFGDFLEGLGREVVGEGDGTVGKARKAGAFVLEELLDFLEGRGGSGATGGASSDYDGSKPEIELNFAREELKSLQSLEETLKSESETWERKAELARSSGDTAAEKKAMQKVFDARDRRSNIRRRALRATERVEYLEKVIFENGKKKDQQQQQRGDREDADGPGAYTILHDRTKVGPSAELSDKWVAELNSGAVVQVLEVDSSRAKGRLRGRLEGPVGWISLLNTDTGYRFARRAPSADRQSDGPASQSSRDASDRSWSPPPKKDNFDADAALAELKSKKGASGR